MDGFKNVLIVGMGEVGSSLYDLAQASGLYNVYGYDIDISKTKNELSSLPVSVDIIHICFVCTNTEIFKLKIYDYIKMFNPKLVIINSTLPPTTTDNIIKNMPITSQHCGIVYSPIFGTHRGKEYMKWEMQRWTKMIGTRNQIDANRAQSHFLVMNIHTKITKSPLEAEFIKVMETTYYGWMIAFFQEFHRLVLETDADFVEIVGEIAETHKKRLDKPIFYPSVIGGHCVMQNIKLLKYIFGEKEFLNIIEKSNNKCKNEITNVKVNENIEMIKYLYEELQQWLETSVQTRKEK